MTSLASEWPAAPEVACARREWLAIVVRILQPDHFFTERFVEQIREREKQWWAHEHDHCILRLIEGVLVDVERCPYLLAGLRFGC
jgi:hypothetical protein